MLSIFTVYQVVNVFNIIFLAIHVVQGRLGLLALREWFSRGWQIDREFSNGVIDFKRFYKTVCCEAFRVNLKLEGLSATGSIKVKSGLRMISQLSSKACCEKA